jgi:hypothetical protein
MPQILHQNREKLTFLHFPKTDKANKKKWINAKTDYRPKDVYVNFVRASNKKALK